MGTLRVSTITDEAGTGPVEFSNGINVSGGTVTGIDPFKYTAVSGATQALDVGDYNFFDAGTLTADTTVSFSNVPTEARWTYVAEAGGTAGWDISAARYIRNFSIYAQDTDPQCLFFKPDGTAMYFVGNTGNAVYEYSLSTAWNVSTASYVQNFSVTAQATSPTGLFFKPDGTAMYVSNTGGGGYVYEYSLSTAWDISTASYVRNFWVVYQETDPWGIFFKPDGTAMYVFGWSGRDVNEYSLSTAWDISTASYVQNFSVYPTEYNPRDIFFKPDGTVMYVSGTKGVHEYSLSTAWDISTASYVQSFSATAPQDPYINGLFFKPDGTTMYVLGSNYDAVYEYSTETPTSITVPASVQNPPSEVVYLGAKASYTFYTADGGTNVYLINEGVL